MGNFTLYPEKKKPQSEKHTKPKQVRVKPLRCNLCGKELDLWDMQEDFTIKTRLGYGTSYDGAKLHLRICCDCMETLIDQCSISPIFDTYST